MGDDLGADQRDMFWHRSLVGKKKRNAGIPMARCSCGQRTSAPDGVCAECRHPLFKLVEIANPDSHTRKILKYRQSIVDGEAAGWVLISETTIVDPPPLSEAGGLRIPPEGIVMREDPRTCAICGWSGFGACPNFRYHDQPPRAAAREAIIKNQEAQMQAKVAQFTGTVIRAKKSPSATELGRRIKA